MSARVLIVLHEKDPYPDGPSYFAWGLVDVWREMGLDVQVVRGPREREPADLVIPHIHRTVTPRREPGAGPGPRAEVGRGRA